MRITPDKRSLGSLVADAPSGRICLPNFQRSFVWKRDEVADLVRSVLRGYYIGSLLLLRVDPERPPFDPAPLRGSTPANTELRPEYLALDGQQRLTSFVYAMTAPDLSLKDSSKRRWFFVDLDLLISDPEDDEVVFDRSERDVGALLDREEQYQRHVLPCTELLDLGQFMQWRDGLDDWLREHRPDEHALFRDTWRDAWTKAVDGFHHFDVPYIELSGVKDDDPEAVGRVCAIFEKLNSTGVDLSVYDLMTARLYRHQIRLHDLWDEALKKHGRLKRWSRGKADHRKLGVLVLRTLALLRDLDPKPRILVNLDPKDFEEDWRRAAAAIERAFELIEHVGEDGFGVFDEKWLPGLGLVPVLAALRATVEDHKLGDEARADVRRWYWSNVFMERYSSAVESKSRKDYSEFSKYWLADGPRPAVFTEAQAIIGSEGYTVRDSASYASAVYSGVFCLLALRNARDWRRLEAIELQKLDDHHIFPRAFLKRHGITTRTAVNTIANRTLISDETNKMIRDKAPADYVDDSTIFPAGPEGVGAAHFLTGSALQSMRQATEDLSAEEVSSLLDEFSRQRESAIIVDIRRLCGVELVARRMDDERSEAFDIDAAAVGGAEEVPSKPATAFAGSTVLAAAHAAWDARADLQVAITFYELLSVDARRILDLLVDRAGVAMSGDEIADELELQNGKRSVAGTLSSVGFACNKLSRAHPFEWEGGDVGEDGTYAMSTEIALLFAAARQQASPD